MVGAASVASMLTDVVLPCLNEAAALPWVLSRMPPGYRPIVADNGSGDGSAEIAARFGALVVTVPQRGFGAACHGGLMAATSDVVCFMDADGSLDPGDLPLIAGPVLAGAADLVLGRRCPEGVGAWPLHARLGNQVIAAAVRHRTGIRLRDLGPMRAARRADLVRLSLRDRRFGYPLEMVIRAAQSGWRVGERDIPYRQRRGRSKVTGTVGGTLRTARDMGMVLAAVTVSRPDAGHPRRGGTTS
jgi:glycosyltransferase involved in cell wall biosynthesis